MMSANSKFLNEARELVGRWGKTGLLEGIDNRYERDACAVLLENQRLMNEVSTDTGDIAMFKRISIPLVRRIYPQLIANKIVSVQPLLGPTGLVYYLRFRYSSNKGATRGADVNGGFPADDQYSLQQRADGTANLDIWYTSQFVQNEQTSTDAGGLQTSQYAPLEHTPILAGTVTGTVYKAGVAIQTFTVSSTGTFNFNSLVAGVVGVASTGSLNLSTGEIVVNWTAAPGPNNLVVSYEYNMECNQDLPEINLVVESEEIAAKTRKLKAVWSVRSSTGPPLPAQLGR